jgi:hypothetical protein
MVSALRAWKSDIKPSRLIISRYGDYEQEPEEPTVGTAAYPEKIYNSWDPNWRGFIGTAFIVGLEEFGHLITPEVTSLLLESLRNSTRGDEYRVGGVDTDNLYPAYTNPVSFQADDGKLCADRFSHSCEPSYQAGPVAALMTAT